MRDHSSPLSVCDNYKIYAMCWHFLLGFRLRSGINLSRVLYVSWQQIGMCCGTQLLHCGAWCIAECLEKKTNYHTTIFQLTRDVGRMNTPWTIPTAKTTNTHNARLCWGRPSAKGYQTLPKISVKCQLLLAWYYRRLLFVYFSFFSEYHSM